MHSSIGTIFLLPSALAPGTARQILPPQTVETISQLDYFLVENIRTARRFISELQIGKVIDQLAFQVMDKDTPLSVTDTYVKTIIGGQDAGVLSEAGCPGIADPGSALVRAAHRHGIRVAPLVGPSSMLLALMASGFNGQSFAFHGYLPIPKNERIRAIKALERDAVQKNQTQLFMETPFRNHQLLADVLQHGQPHTPLCIASQITAPDEFIRTKTIAEWRKNVPDLHKKPTVFLLYRA